ncbi:TerD family protein [Yoonia sp. BS5-3]|uniref:TerD family protein n=1 Tax=Yoonia phaeophyticola TaxID=3137369 RepID=A0ABZ2V1B1_9RHOB
MTLSLSKGQTISLGADTVGLRKLHIGVGWDPVMPNGFLGKLTSPKDIDLDASLITFDAGKKPIGIVYFGQLKSADGAIVHSGDNLTGDDIGDDEVIKVDLTQLDPKIESLVLFVNSYQGQSFDEVDNAFCRVLDDDTETELCRFTLSDQGAHTGVVMAVITRNDGDWQLKAIGVPGNGRTADQLVPDAQQHI